MKQAALGVRLAAGLLAAALLAAAGLLPGTAARAADRHALWRIVHGACVPDQEAHHVPAPCAVVDEAHGFAVLKDRRGREQYLLIPTARISGIESPELLRPDAPNYFAEAWGEMRLVEARLSRRLPADDLSLAINSAYGRSQDQLHIHMECIRPAVRAALAAEQGRITSGGWSDLPEALAGDHYRAIRINGPALATTSPFRLLAASLADPAGQMGHHTLVLVGAPPPAGGFILLDGRSNLLLLDRGSGEALQDHDCMIARTAPGSARN